ncbi:MAG: hypothetical protein ACREVR_02660 [Burkholderiales bacterium]
MRYQIALEQVAAVQPARIAPVPGPRWVPSDALAALVSVQRRAQLEWGERLE